MELRAKPIAEVKDAQAQRIADIVDFQSVADAVKNGRITRSEGDYLVNYYFRLWEKTLDREKSS